MNIGTYHGTGGTGPVKGYTSVLVGTWWYWFSMGWCGSYLVALGQYGEELVDTRWYVVSKGRCRLVIGGAGSV